MKNIYFSKLFVGFTAFIAVFAVLGLAVPAQGAYYYDQYGKAVYYDTYTVPGGQYYLATNPAYGAGYYAGSAYGSAYYTNYGIGYNTSYNSGYNNVPVIYSTPFREVKAGDVYVAGTNALDADNDPLFYQLVSGPAGMTVNPNTGFIRFENTSGKGGQSFPVTVGVTDGRSPLVTQSFTLSVIGATSRTGVVTTGSNSDVTSGNSTSGNSKYTSSIFSALFGSSKSSPEIVISNVNVISGPKNINDNTDQNCESYVSWSTNTATAGQVVYGTASQQSLANYAYPNTAPEGNAYSKVHQVKLGCLANTTHFFRVVAFSASDRAVSDEYTIFPVTIRTQIPNTTASIFSSTDSSSTGSIGSLFLRLITHPIILLILVVGIIWYVLRTFLYRINNKAKLAQQSASATVLAHSAVGAHADPHAQIPMLAVPHH